MDYHTKSSEKSGTAIVDYPSAWEMQTSTVQFRREPEPSDWYVQYCGDQGIRFHPRKGNEPNWFHRKMQELIFGVKWINSKKL